MMLKHRLRRVKRVTLERPYVFFFIIFFISYIFLNVVANKVYVTKDVLFYNLGFGIPYVIFTTLVAALIAININLMAIKFKEMKDLREMRKAGGLTSAGIFGGFLAGACPGCFVGIFPALLGLFGVSASLSALPFYGIEIQALSAILLLGSVFLLTKDSTCTV